METLYYDLQVTVERNKYGAIVITSEIADKPTKETYFHSEQFYGYSIADAVERFAEENGLDLWDSLDNMREELGDVVDVCPDEETEDAD